MNAIVNASPVDCWDWLQLLREPAGEFKSENGLLN